MKNQTIIPFAFATIDNGYRNQILGAFRAILELTGEEYDIDNLFVLPKDCSHYNQVKPPLNATMFQSYKDFSDYMVELLDNFMEHSAIIPNVFITVYNATEIGIAGENADKMCRVVKDYYQKKII